MVEVVAVRIVDVLPAGPLERFLEREKLPANRLLTHTGRTRRPVKGAIGSLATSFNPLLQVRQSPHVPGNCCRSDAAGRRRTARPESRAHSSLHRARLGSARDGL
jgi:hypothetical protein